MDEHLDIERALVPQYPGVPAPPREHFWEHPQVLTVRKPHRSPRAWLRKLWRVAQEETQGLHPRLLLVNLLFGSLPPNVGGRLKVYGLRLAGFDVGWGTTVWGMPLITGNGDLTRRLTIGRWCRFNLGCMFELGASITIGDCVNLGHHVLILTTTHRVSSGDRRADSVHTLSPVVIGRGAWIGSRSTILPGVTIGERAIVGAGSVVNKDIPANVLAAGTPARVIKELS